MELRNFLFYKDFNNPERVKQIVLTMFEYLLLFLIFFSFSQEDFVLGKIGLDNISQISLLDVGNSEPVITSIEVTNPIILSPNSTKLVLCSSIIEEYQGDVDLKNVSAEFYELASGKSFGSLDDKNDHYTNSSCILDTNYGDSYTAQANCTFEVAYYANPGSWNCTIEVYDFSDFSVRGSNSTEIETLLALGLPDSLNFGIVNATTVSSEAALNITNYGNVEFNLTLEGYAQTRGDGYAMNCSKGSNKLINAEYEKYNLTASTAGSLTLSEFENNYLNLTSSPVTKYFGLDYRQSTAAGESSDNTYWRIYVPRGVAGTCEGNIIFGATTGIGS